MTYDSGKSTTQRSSGHCTSSVKSLRGLHLRIDFSTFRAITLRDKLNESLAEAIWLASTAQNEKTLISQLPTGIFLSFGPCPSYPAAFPKQRGNLFFTLARRGCYGGQGPSRRRSERRSVFVSLCTSSLYSVPMFVAARRLTTHVLECGSIWESGAERDRGKGEMIVERPLPLADMTKCGPRNAEKPRGTLTKYD